MRTWEKHDIGATPGFGGDLQKALASIKAQMLYMPSVSDLYFPVTDARYEAQFIPRCTQLPIPSLWGHPAGAGASPADLKFLNEHIGEFLKSAGTTTSRPMGRLIDSGDIAFPQHQYGHARCLRSQEGFRPVMPPRNTTRNGRLRCSSASE
jgi:hypothetical protein